MKPQVSLIARLASFILIILGFILLLCLLRHRNYFPLSTYQDGSTHSEHLGIVTWQFTVSVSLLAATLVALGLLLCAQLCCAMRWSFETKMLLLFHGGLTVVLLVVVGILIQWLNSDSSPKQYDITPGNSV